ncbi:hypothetical protein [Polynucleobacter sp. 80A-SIGWE]|uniref:hypothetical protein n=1 Tax=Polynucleobacter sp. 80A-SIGWE TaxID=2689100 RepID=UPI001C0C7ECB|nr:hypothetical protein [Polynucleobacter sp. 80A-SIGWE]MBU3590006.1 hypothetical protein [Polynucleobacter sp. 80A-SIGWE]
MIRLLSAAVAVLAFLSGCATTEKYEAKLNSMIGMPESQLVEQWGIPTGMYEADGTRYLSYTNTESGYVAGTPPVTRTTMINGKAYTNTTGGTSGYGYTNSCTTTFMVVNKKIASWKHKGNDCKSD